MIVESLISFWSAFLTVYLLGVQSQMVRDGLYIGAMVGSALIGLSQFFVYTTVTNLELGSFSWFCFIIAGPLAIACSIYTHPKLVKVLDKIKRRG